MRLAPIAAAALVLALGCMRHDAAESGQPGPGSARRVKSQPMPLPLPASKVARLLVGEPFELRGMKRAEGGVMGVSRAEAYFPHQRLTLPIKWKIAPGDADGWNNTPRKELAAFAIQQWFLDERDWLVPPSALRCVPSAEHDHFVHAPAVVEGTRCVLGLVAAWLEHVKTPDVVYEPARFQSEPAYALHRANMNLLTYLIDHRDGRLSNFLVPQADRGPIYVIDNGISFGSLVWNYFVPNWNDIRVPALPRAAIDRLRRVTSADMSKLLVLVELHADDAGVLQPVPSESPWESSTGARLRPGRVQLGLTADETTAVAERVTRLLARVDAGEIPLF